MPISFAVPPHPAAPDAATDRSITMRVLVVDDEEDQFVLVRRLLSTFSSPRFEVEWAASPAAGLAALERATFDVCLVDYRLGLADGVRFIQEAKLGHAQMPYILVTGRGDRSVDIQAMGAGAIDYLSKGSLDGAGLERAIRYATTQQALVTAVRRDAERTEALDEVSQALSRDGPSSLGLDLVLGAVEGRLGHSRSAVYLLAGDQLKLGAARGFTHPIPSLAAANGPLGRVLAQGRSSVGPSWTESGTDPSGQFVVPMTFESRTVGLLTVAVSVDQPLHAPDQAVLREISFRVGMAIGLHQERRWLTEGRQLLRRAGQFLEGALAEPPGPDHLERVLSRLRGAFSADGFAVAMPQGEEELLVRSAIGSLADRQGRPIGMAHSVAARARVGRIVQVDSSGPSCAAFVPVPAGSHSLGLLWVDRRGLGAQYSALETEALSLLGAELGLVMSVAQERARATAAGVRDEETGLYTRPFLDALLAGYGAMVGSTSGSVGFVLAAPRDVDGVSDDEARAAEGALRTFAASRVDGGPDIAVQYGPGTVAILVREEPGDRTAPLVDRLSGADPEAGAPGLAVGWAVRPGHDLGSLVSAAEMALELSRRTGAPVEA